MIFDPLLDLFRGKAVTIPPMDGALQPNTALEEAEAVVRTDGAGQSLLRRQPGLFSSGCQVFALAGMPAMRRSRSPVSTRRSPPWRHRRRAISRSRWMMAAFRSAADAVPAPGGLACPTALAFGDADTLYVCHGSAEHRASDWVAT